MDERLRHAALDHQRLPRPAEIAALLSVEAAQRQR